MKNLYKIILSIYIITLSIATIFAFSFHLFISVVLLIVAFCIPHISYRADYLGYVYLTQVLGTTCGFYNLPYYDKCMHFLSGAIFVIIGYALLKDYIKQRRVLIILINCVETAIAFFWEVFEYSGLLFFHYDASRHFTTGVHDTMQDMIFSFVAGLIMSYVIYKYPSYIDNLYKWQPDNQNSISQQ